MGRISGTWIVGISALLTACSSAPASIAESEHVGGLPAEAITAKPGSSGGDRAYAFPTAGWLDGGARFAVVLAGSSSCPAFPSSIEVADPDTVKLGLNTRGGPNCTADMVPRTYIIRTPSGIDSSRPAKLLLGETTVALPPL
ncbi:hypothetical protein [Arthrobacter sp. OY3WO11]|uniref:hypothetical protein n=1 Tax=Arthrobacter sp. OY3WO11 TaxID=1835723 RepID=UPI0007CFBEF8|nr:hypothetical protein [Arthrobacter sp. OY3WO11]OAE01673.1 hypothetical protein A6A22_09790 [Arthrobacter sp. OY3WO11]